MAISAKDVMNLRQRTGLGMMECKKALNETGGDFDAAVKLLRETMGSKMDERSGREATEGAIASAKADGAVTLVQLVSETDFAARNDNFIAGAEKIAALVLDQPEGEVTEAAGPVAEVVEDLRITIKENISLRRAVKLTGDRVGSYVHHNRKVGAAVAVEGDFSDELLTGLCQHITAAVPPLTPEPLAVDESGLPAEAVEAARQQFEQEAAASGKPAQIIEKMVEGKMRKWKDEHTLLGQTYIRELDAKKPVRDYLPKGGRILRYVRYANG